MQHIKDATGPERNQIHAQIVVGLVIAMILVTVICTIASVGVGHEKSIRPVVSQFVCMVVFQIVLVSFILDYSAENYKVISSRLTLLLDLGIVNTCADKYNVVPYDVDRLEIDFLNAEKN